MQVHVTGPLRSNDADALVAAAVDSLGIVLLPDWLVAQELKQHQLQRLLEDYTVYTSATERCLHLLYPVNRRTSAKVRAFADYLREHLQHALTLR